MKNSLGEKILEINAPIVDNLFVNNNPVLITIIT